MLGLCLVAACGPGSVTTTDDPASASGPVDTDSATGSVLTSTPTPTTTASDPTGTTMPGLPDTTSTATTATTAPDTTTTTATTSDGASTGEPTCPEGTVLCIDDAIATCDGRGGFEPAPPDNACTFGCADESKCTTCEQAIAKKACPAGLPRVHLVLGLPGKLGRHAARAPDGHPRARHLRHRHARRRCPRLQRTALTRNP